jgi:hypothetical protein
MVGVGSREAEARRGERERGDDRAYERYSYR